QPCPFGRTSGSDLQHHEAAVDAEAGDLCVVPQIAERIRLDAQPGPPDITERDQIPGDSLDCIGWNCKADARIAARWGNDRSVDADDFSTGVEQRSAGVAGVDGRISLNDVLDDPSIVRLDRTAK